MFDGSTKETLSDLFAGRSQFIYHADHPDDKAGCHARTAARTGLCHQSSSQSTDVTMVVMSRAPLDKSRRTAAHGLDFKWVSSHGADFNFDYQASFTPEEMAAKRAFYNFTMRDPLARDREGHSVFYKDERGSVFHTYSCYDRGNDKLNIHYHYLDIVPKGRDEQGRGPYWVRRRSEYER
jgi:predicted dithiol-disulfide oxidoreductase (DUF899 family)